MGDEVDAEEREQDESKISCSILAEMQNTESSPFFPTFREVAFTAIAFFAVTFAVYGPSLGSSFVALDDPFLIYNNLAIRSITPATLKHIFTTYDPELYIPFTFLSFQLNYLIGGLSPFSFHLLNLILHTLNALMVTWLFVLLTKNKPASIFGGLLFALHPLNTEVVIWATARKESLSAFFFLISLLSYLYYTQGSRKAYVLSIVAFLFALLSKVTVFTLPLIVILTDWLQGKPFNRKTLIDKIPYFFLSALFVLVGIIPKTSILTSTTFSEKILMAGKSTMFYLWKFILPIHLSILYPNKNPITLSSLEFPLAVAALAAIIVCVLLSMRRTKTLAYGFGFFFILLSPTLVHFNRNAGIQSGNGTGIQFASDHYAYIPSIGLLYLCVLFVLWLWNLPSRTRDAKNMHRALVSSAGIIVGVFAVLSLHQSTFWFNSETLFAHTLSIYPYSTAARVNLSVIYRKTERFEEEQKVLEDGLQFGPNSKLETGLAAIDVRKGDIESAERHYQNALRIDPKNSEVFFDIGVMRSKEGKIAEALENYGRALSIDSKYVAVYNNIGSLLLDEGKDVEAEKNFRTAVTLNPSFQEGFQNLGSLYAGQKKWSDAEDAFLQALSIDQSSVEIRLQLVPIELELGKNTQAFDLIKEIIKIDPKNAEAKALIKQMIKLGIIG